VNRWGACIPLECSPKDVLAALFWFPGAQEITSLIESSCDSGGFVRPAAITYILVSVIAVLALLLLWATLTDNLQVSTYGSTINGALYRFIYPSDRIVVIFH